MPAKKKGPRMVREIFRLRAAGLGTKAIARALGMSKNTVKAYLREQEQLTAAGISESGVQALKVTLPQQPAWSLQVDWEACHEDVAGGTALLTWWEENVANIKTGDVAGVPYVTFWRHFGKRYPKIDLDYHKLHPPGKSSEIDFKGADPELVFWSRETNEWVQCRLFGCVLSFSQMFYAEATITEKQADWFACTQNSFRFFGGVSETIVCDNPAALVSKASRYDPECNPEFLKFCEHYNTVPQPARPYSPKDKNLIEVSLGVFWRWVRPKIKREKFYSLGEMNAFIRDRVVEFDMKVRRKTGMSRKAIFEATERQNLRALPETDFEFGEWKKAKVHPDCHIQHQYNFYSVPWKYVGQEVDVRVSRSFLEIYASLERQAIHKQPLSKFRGKYITDDAHLPEAHRAMREDAVQKVLNTAQYAGPATFDLIQRLLQQARHPLLYLRRCQGIMRLRRCYSSEKLENACVTIAQIGISMPRLADVEGIIKNSANTGQIANAATPKRNPNPNLRGKDYWAPQKEVN
jgi:transposase